MSRYYYCRERDNFKLTNRSGQRCITTYTTLAWPAAGLHQNLLCPAVDMTLFVFSVLEWVEASWTTLIWWLLLTVGKPDNNNSDRFYESSEARRRLVAILNAHPAIVWPHLRVFNFSYCLPISGSNSLWAHQLIEYFVIFHKTL